MKTPWIPVVLLGLGAMTCLDSPFPCPRYCWSHKQAVPDLTNEDMQAGSDGRFDETCTQFQNLVEWHPPLPPFGFYGAEVCLAGDQHRIIAHVVESIQDPLLDASAACDVTGLQVYADLAQTLASRAKDACVAHLTCNGAPGGCDIDPGEDDDQACTVSSAEDLCDQVVYGPALAALGDLTNGPGAAQPERDGTITEPLDDPKDCEAVLQDTDGVPTCAEGPGPEGVDSTGEGSGAGPFGDVDALVSCTSATTCTFEPALMLAVQQNFAVFHDEGVWLERVDLPGVGRGVQLRGVEAGEATAELLGVFGLGNGDIITHVDGVSLGSLEGIEQVLTELPTASTWSVTVWHATGSGWSSVDYSIARGP